MQRHGRVGEGKLTKLRSRFWESWVESPFDEDMRDGETLMLPLARQDNLLVQELMGEVVVYDQGRHKVHKLNAALATVWQHCDGQTSFADLSALLQRDMNLPADPELVRLALGQLADAHLLQDGMPRPTNQLRPSRRAVIRKLGLAGGLALAVPAVASIVAPTPANAASGGNGQGGNGQGGNGQGG
jgi:hypothetical protein